LSILETEEVNDRELENASTQGDSREPDEESDIEEFSLDELLIEDEDEEAMYCSE
jgi:hypothetical protein